MKSGYGKVTLRRHTQKAWRLIEIQKTIAEFLKLLYGLGGTISGEHEIGLIQKEYMHIVFNEVQLQLMRSIRHTFDPNNILNTGKIFD